jgi:hypothetical protein
LARTSLFHSLRSPNMANTTCERRANKVPPRGPLLFEDTPIWMQVDPRIRRGYREELRTLWACTLSLFYVHNEFVNIWSHFAPALIHFFLLVRGARGALEDNGKKASAMDTAMVQLYILSVILCLLSSVSLSKASLCAAVTNSPRVRTTYSRLIRNAWPRMS